MAVSSTTDYLDDSLLTELFEDPLISSLIDRISPAATSSHLPTNGTSIMNRRHWSQDESVGHFKQSNTQELPSSTTNGADLKHLLNTEVVLKTDVFNGKKGTINTISYDGLATVTIEGGIQIRLPYGALQLIPPKPGDKVIVISGALRGLPGTLLSAEGNDGIFMSQVDHKIWVVKLHTLAKTSGHSYPHHHQQSRTSSTSSMYSHQVPSPSSPNSPNTPTSATVRPTPSMFLAVGSPLTPPTPSPMRNSPMYSSTGGGGGGGIAPTAPLSPYTQHSSPSPSSSRQTHRAQTYHVPTSTGAQTYNVPTSTGAQTYHVPTSTGAQTHYIPTSTGAQTHYIPTSTGAQTHYIPTSTGAHSMFSMTDSLKQTFSSHPSFLKMPPASLHLKSVVSSVNKSEEGPSTKEWLEYLLRRPRVKKEVPLADDDKDDIKASVVQISLVCPVSQKRMEYPCRGIHCKHLQCFDAEAYISMNKSWRPKMKLKTVNGTYHSSLAIKADSRLKCPVCNKHTPFDALYIDKDLMEMIRTTNITDVEWSGGAWRTIQKSTPSGGGADVIDLTLSDSDNE